SMHVGDGDLRVVERGQNVGNAGADVLGMLGLDDFLCAGVLAQKLGRGGGRRNNRRIRRFGRLGGGSPCNRRRPGGNFASRSGLLRRFLFSGFVRGLLGRFGRGFFGRLGFLLFRSGFLF